VEYVRHPATTRLVAKLRKAGVKLTEDAAAGPKPLAGRTFVLTGELSAFTRTEAETAIRRLGGKSSSSVSTQTDYVVAGANPGSKYARAKALGVTLLDEAQFKKLLQQ